LDQVYLPLEIQARYKPLPLSSAASQTRAKREESEGIYFRLVHEPDAGIAFEKALAELKQAQEICV